MSVRIVEATEAADIRLTAALFEEYRAFYGPTRGLESTYAFLRDRWIARESVLFMAVSCSQGSPLGFVNLYPLFHRVLRFWLVNDLYVRPKFRRAGVGRMLMRRAEQHARETGSAGLTLSTAIDNAEARALYESEGYLRDSQVIHYNRFF